MSPLSSAAYEVDRKLHGLANSFDTVLQVTPTNVAKAWQRFKELRFEEDPEFIYRPPPVNPLFLRQELYRIPIEDVDEEELIKLFIEVRDDINLRLEMRSYLNMDSFKQLSTKLYGTVDAELGTIARQICQRMSSPEEETSIAHEENLLDATAIQVMAESEIAKLQKRLAVENRSQFNATVLIQGSIEGVVVCNDTMYISSRLRLPKARAKAVIQYEIGSLVLNFVNGSAQPLKILSTGLPGFEELQEGIGFIAEHFATGINHRHLLKVAARAIAVEAMQNNATFVETFREVKAAAHVPDRLAFQICMRAHRGGGFSKDVIYLRGFIKIVEYLRTGGSFENLFIGKAGFKYLADLRKLIDANVLAQPLLMPTYTKKPGFKKCLENVRQATGIFSLMDVDNETSADESSY